MLTLSSSSILCILLITGHASLVQCGGSLPAHEATGKTESVGEIMEDVKAEKVRVEKVEDEVDDLEAEEVKVRIEKVEDEVDDLEAEEARMKKELTKSGIKQQSSDDEVKKKEHMIKLVLRYCAILTTVVLLPTVVLLLLAPVINLLKSKVNGQESCCPSCSCSCNCQEALEAEGGEDQQEEGSREDRALLQTKPASPKEAVQQANGDIVKEKPCTAFLAALSFCCVVLLCHYSYPSRWRCLQANFQRANFLFGASAGPIWSKLGYLVSIINAFAGAYVGKYFIAILMRPPRTASQSEIRSSSSEAWPKLTLFIFRLAGTERFHQSRACAVWSVVMGLLVIMEVVPLASGTIDLLRASFYHSEYFMLACHMALAAGMILLHWSYAIVLRQPCQPQRPKLKQHGSPDAHDGQDTGRSCCLMNFRFVHWAFGLTVIAFAVPQIPYVRWELARISHSGTCNGHWPTSWMATITIWHDCFLGPFIRTVVPAFTILAPAVSCAALLEGELSPLRADVEAIIQDERRISHSQRTGVDDEWFAFHIHEACTAIESKVKEVKERWNMCLSMTMCLGGACLLSGVIFAVQYSKKTIGHMVHANNSEVNNTCPQGCVHHHADLHDLHDLQQKIQHLLWQMNLLPSMFVFFFLQIVSVATYNTSVYEMGRQVSDAGSFARISQGHLEFQILGKTLNLQFFVGLVVTAAVSVFASMLRFFVAK